MEILAKDEDSVSPFVIHHVRSNRAQYLADQIVLCYADEPTALTAHQEALLLKIEHLIKRTGGTYKKFLGCVTDDIAYDFNPMQLMIPRHNLRLLRFLNLINAFDETIIAIDAAWLNHFISIGDRSTAIRQLEGRVYRALERLNCKENTYAE